MGELPGIAEAQAVDHLPAIDTKPAEQAEDDVPEMEKIAQRSPPWLVSAIIHSVLLIVLALIAIAGSEGIARIELDASTYDEDLYAEDLGEQLELDIESEMLDPMWNDIITPEDLNPVDNPFATPADFVLSDLLGRSAETDLQSPVIGLALQGREPGSKEGLLAKYGGNRSTQEAVARGLAWLARQQRSDGSWSLSGPYRDGVGEDFDNPYAATAMALLAFQGDGQTHRRGRFRKNVKDGWQWLLGQQDADGCFFRGGPANQRFYTQGQCAIAVCEMYGMTKDGEFFQPAKSAIDYLLKCQSDEGGWRYQPCVDSDVSVTGWIVMALKSAQMAGLQVPDEAWKKIGVYLDQTQLNGGARYPYKTGQRASLTMTAEAILMRQYLGWPRDNPAMISAMEWITADENLVNYQHNRDCYYWYYATQAAHHMSGVYWRRWNDVMRQELPKHQERQSSEAGSWDPYRPTFDQWSPHAGRLFTTCLSIYMLEVYYRHLPIYENVYDVLKQR